MDIQKLLLAYTMVEGGRKAVRVAKDGIERCGDGDASGARSALQVAEKGLARSEDDLKIELLSLAEECRRCFAQYLRSMDRDPGTHIEGCSFDIPSRTFIATLVIFAVDPEEELGALNERLQEYNAELKEAGLPFTCVRFSLIGF